MVRARTQDGHELVDFFYQVFREEKFTVSATTITGKVVKVMRRPTLRENKRRESGSATV